jgi:hypothetical protein
VDAESTFDFDTPGVYFLVVDANERAEPFQLTLERQLAANICANPPPIEDEQMDLAPNEGGIDAGLADAGPVDMGVTEDAAINDMEDQGGPAIRDIGPIVDSRPMEDARAPNPEDAAIEEDMAMSLDVGPGPSLDQGIPPNDASAGDAGPMQGDAGMGDAGAVPVAPPEFVPFCCGDEESDWVEGSLSYEHDQDWYAYPHPCPGEDCMVRIVYQLDAGPVDHLMQVYTNTNLWFDTIIPIEEKDEHQAATGQIGGVGAGDRCFYAFQGHEANGQYFYAISIRDLLPRRDWSSEQKYRFCIEKVADGCLEPPCRRNPVTDSAGDVIREECSVR